MLQEALRGPQSTHKSPTFQGEDTRVRNSQHSLVSYSIRQSHTVKPVFKTTWEIGTPWELRTATSVPRCIQYVEMDLRNKTTSEIRTVFLSPLGVPNSQVALYIVPSPGRQTPV